MTFSTSTTTTTTMTTTIRPVDDMDILRPKPTSYEDKEQYQQKQQQQQSFNIPKRLRQKVVGIDDAVSLISNNDAISCSGFVAQGMYTTNHLVNC
jgi:hypothetical protein